MLWYSEGAYWINTAGFMSGGAGLITDILRTGIHGLDTDFELLGHNGIVGVWGGWVLYRDLSYCTGSTLLFDK